MFRPSKKYPSCDTVTSCSLFSQVLFIGAVAIIAEPKILPDLPGYREMSSFDKLWMCLFSRLGDLCLDPRPATRF
jgi:hypothetical protein